MRRITGIRQERRVITASYEVVNDPDQAAPLHKGLWLQKDEVDWMQRYDCFTMGTIIRHKNGETWQVQAGKKHQELVRIV